MKKLYWVPLLTFLLLIGCGPQSNREQSANTSSKAPIEIKVVLVTMFEIGEDQGDKPGEFQLWKAGQKLDTCLPFDTSFHDICLNQETGVLGIVTGMGISRATAAIMALGLDPRFDLTQAYWLVAGIAGVDPADASIGSAAWATYLVDGDLAHEIDAREIPKEWNSGYFPLFANHPVKLGETAKTGELSKNGEVFKLNEDLVNWAYNLTKDTPLNDYPAMQTLRNQYTQQPNAQKPPFVLKGDQMSASTFWHGDMLNQWANDWTYYWTQGKGNFVMSGMEDSGAFQAMTYLHNAKKADKNRFLVLRTASNYATPPADMTAAQNLANESGEEGFVGMRSALESAYLVGSKVVDTIVANWDTVKSTLPYESNKIKTSIGQTVPKQLVIPLLTEVKAQNRDITRAELIASLELQGHVEGGYFKQTSKANHREKINTDNGPRTTMTSIYYLLTADSPIGHFHMNQSDIMHFFHKGDPITYYLIDTAGNLTTTVLGPDPRKGHKMQMMVKGGTWKASKIPTDQEYGYGLIGEAVSPGFEYADMQLGKTDKLIRLFPQHKLLINQLSR
ncbi:cupin domain-containing protein [Paraglaciecola aquimarina]|uniref:Cupin domain-containing protein n=1 Tax=Paraglaciecola algarum TaxID=3050085 RepID=A0ABS9DBH9_9ALTE|nr:cupin domain-containing protein [Paraglaciecola sp. G1-23]MCF2948986.1 cupin domain-containing protein [Paraglaciecola sp. G1-23]